MVLVAQQEHKRNNITLDSHDYLHMLHKGETALWETEHNARWLACLEAVQEAWQEHEEA